MVIQSWSQAARRLMYCAAACIAIAVMSPTAKAAFHLWAINEIYSNSSGSLQFIELTDTFGGQNFVGGLNLQAFNTDGTQNHLFTLPNTTLPGSTLNHSLLFGTAGLQAAGGPTPDYIIPDGFLYTPGGFISFFGLNSNAYTGLPSDGIHSLLFPTGPVTVNSPRNYAGQTGTVPAPASLVLAAGGGWLALRRRRSA